MTTLDLHARPLAFCHQLSFDEVTSGCTAPTGVVSSTHGPFVAFPPFIVVRTQASGEPDIFRVHCYVTHLRNHRPLAFSFRQSLRPSITSPLPFFFINVTGQKAPPPDVPILLAVILPLPSCRHSKSLTVLRYLEGFSYLSLLSYFRGLLQG